jgi:hypothetical protein
MASRRFVRLSILLASRPSAEPAAIAKLSSLVCARLFAMKMSLRLIYRPGGCGPTCSHGCGLATFLVHLVLEPGLPMTIVACLLIVAGMLIIAMALGRPSFDLAIAVTRGWHVTVFPPPIFVGVLAILIGIATFAFRLGR